KNTAISNCDAAEVTGHNATKPLTWMIWAVQLGSCESETILDPFCGSGTTLVAAKKLGRHYLGMDISETYCRIARERLTAIDRQPSLFEQKPEQLGLIPEAEAQRGASRVRARGSADKQQSDSSEREPDASSQSTGSEACDEPR